MNHSNPALSHAKVTPFRYDTPVLLHGVIVWRSDGVVRRCSGAEQWTQAEDRLLLHLANKYRGTQWERISNEFGVSGVGTIVFSVHPPIYRNAY